MKHEGPSREAWATDAVANLDLAGLVGVVFGCREIRSLATSILRMFEDKYRSKRRKMERLSDWLDHTLSDLQHDPELASIARRGIDRWVDAPGDDRRRTADILPEIFALQSAAENRIRDRAWDRRELAAGCMSAVANRLDDYLDGEALVYLASRGHCIDLWVDRLARL